MPKKRVDIVRLPDGDHAVREEKTGHILFRCSTQAEARKWALSCDFEINIHRERNRDSDDEHGQFR